MRTQVELRLSLPRLTKYRRLVALCCILPAIFIANPTHPARAAGTQVVSTCDETHLRDAMTAAGAGGTVQFGCSGSIALAATISIDSSLSGLTIDGAGQAVTISGEHRVEVFAVNGGATLNLQHLTIANGAAAQGGGINDAGVLNVADSTFTGNNARTGVSEGGAIYTYRGTVNVANSTFTGNSAGTGAGINNAFGTVNVANSTFNGDVVVQYGGGVFQDYGTTTLANTIIANSAKLVSYLGGNCDNYAGLGQLIDGGGNISDDTTCGFTAASSQSSTNPLLGPLATNGGPTQTMALLPGSPAIGAGVAATCAGAAIGGLDQRGSSRGAVACDSGAYEGTLALPRLAQSFSPTSVVVGQPSILTLTLSNSGSAGTQEPLTGVAATATLGAGLSLGSAATTCANGKAAFSGQKLSFSGASLPAGGSCTVTLTVTPTSAGSPTSAVPAAGSAGALTADQTGAVGSGSTAALTVAQAATSSTLTNTPNPGTAVYGQPLSFATSVNANAPSAATIDEGSVTFYDGAPTAKPLGTANVSGGSAGLTCGTGQSGCPSVLGAGNHTIYAKYSDSGATAGFQGSTTSAPGQTLALTVTGAPLTITADNKSMTYGGAVPAFTIGYSGFVNGDSSSVVSGLACGAKDTHGAPVSSGTPAGTYAISCSGAGAANYSISYVPGTLTIGQAPLTITADNLSTVYGQGNPTFTVAANGLVNGDTLASLQGTLSFATPATQFSAPGQYTVTPSGLKSPNYTISYTAGTLTIGKDGSMVVLTSSLNPAPFGQPVVLTARVSAAAPGAGTPSGSVTFLDGGVSLGSAPLVAGQASLSTATLLGSSHTLTVSYAGDADFTGGASAALSQSITFSRTLGGPTSGGQTIHAGEAVRISGAVYGPITVQPGGSLALVSATVFGSVTITGAGTVALCGSTVNGAVAVRGSSGLVRIGSGQDDGAVSCAANTLRGSLLLDGNQGGIAVEGTTISGSLSLTNSTGSAANEDSAGPELEGNHIGGALACSGNTPAPVADGQPNTVGGNKAGQCNVPNF